MALSRAERNARDLENRNALARSLGFTSRAAMRRAQERREFPSAFERQENTEFAVRALAEAEQRVRSPQFQKKLDKSRVRLPAKPRKQKVSFTEVPKGIPTNGRTYRDEKSHQWSLAHSHKERSKFHDDWPEERKQAYYDAFVDGWNLPADERQDLYDYLVEYWEFDPDPDSSDWVGYR